MSLEANKQLVRAFLEHAYAGRVDAACALLSDDAIWWVLGDAAQLRVAGSRDAAGIERLLRGLNRLAPEGMRVMLHAITAEADRVAVEAEVQAALSTGKLLHNRYHYLFHVRGGKVSEVREYMDTLHVFQVMQG